MKKQKIITIIGAGPAGIFAAIHAAKTDPCAKVSVMESSYQLLSKVKVSGGGRCNVTHECQSIRVFTSNYPRGSKELLGPFSYFGPKETIAWFEKQGVSLKTEVDGRIFPSSDDSQSIIDALLNEAKKYAVKIHVASSINKIEENEGGFQVFFDDSVKSFYSDKILLATGGTSLGFSIAKQLGHTIISSVPSLFPFKVKSFSLSSISGVSVDCAKVSLPKLKYDEIGPLLITHGGFSGPSVLNLSSKAAIALNDCGYQTDLRIDWLPMTTEESLRDAMIEKQKKNPQKLLFKDPIGHLPSSLWKELVSDKDLKWVNLGKKQREVLIRAIKASEYLIDGKGSYMVSCGGVKLSEVAFKTFESKRCPGLYFAGEILDIDGVTGGYNFQAAWTMGAIAGKNIAADSDRDN